jgi:hypothetical protein
VIKRDDFFDFVKADLAVFVEILECFILKNKSV